MHGVGAPVNYTPSLRGRPHWRALGGGRFSQGAPISHPPGGGGRRHSVLQRAGQGMFRVLGRGLCLSGAAAGAGRGTGTAGRVPGNLNVATLKLESHLIFMCYEILILALTLFQPFKLVKLFLARGLYGNRHLSGRVHRHSRPTGRQGEPLRVWSATDNSCVPCQLRAY